MRYLITIAFLLLLIPAVSNAYSQVEVEIQQPDKEIKTYKFSLGPEYKAAVYKLALNSANVQCELSITPDSKHPKMIGGPNVNCGGSPAVGFVIGTHVYCGVTPPVGMVMIAEPTPGKKNSMDMRSLDLKCID